LHAKEARRETTTIYYAPRARLASRQESPATFAKAQHLLKRGREARAQRAAGAFGHLPRSGWSIAGKTWLRSGTQEGVGFLMLAHLPDRILDHDRSHALELAALVDELAPGQPAAAALRAWCASLPPRLAPPCGGRAHLLSKQAAPEAAAPMMSEVQLAITAVLPEGAVTTRRISRALGLSARTLQRRLTGRGVSVRCLVEETRRCLALEELRVGSPVAAVAASLGFGDARALARAFKRWTGKTPSAARRQPRLAHGRC
jgi:AraC-like DNA-binding protein